MKNARGHRMRHQAGCALLALFSVASCRSEGDDPIHNLCDVDYVREVVYSKLTAFKEGTRKTFRVPTAATIDGLPGARRLELRGCGKTTDVGFQMDIALQPHMPRTARLLAGFGEGAIFWDRNAKVDVVTTAKTAVLRIGAVYKDGFYDALRIELTLKSRTILAKVVAATKRCQSGPPTR